MIAGSLVSVSATNLIRETAALKTLETSMPHRIMVTMPLVRRSTRAARVATRSTATSPVANERAWTRGPDSPRRMARAAPKDAPEDAPSRSGETTGLRKSPWKAVPKKAFGSRYDWGLL